MKAFNSPVTPSPVPEGLRPDEREQLNARIQENIEQIRSEITEKVNQSPRKEKALKKLQDLETTCDIMLRQLDIPF